MSEEKRTITVDSFKAGDVLVNRTDSSRTARVVEPIKRDNKFTGFLVVFNTGKQGKLSKFDLEKDSCPWVLRGTVIEPVEEQAKPAANLTSEDERILIAADEIWYLDWRENDDDEKTSGWRHPGYFMEVNEPYDFAKLVSMGLMEKQTISGHTSFRISDAGMGLVKALNAGRPTTFEAHDKLTTADGVQAEVKATEPPFVHATVERRDVIMTTDEAKDFPLYKEPEHTCDMCGDEISATQGSTCEKCRMRVADEAAAIADSIDDREDPTQARIAQLEKELKAANDLIVAQENKIERLTDSRDSAIENLDEANSLVNELLPKDDDSYADEVADLRDQIKELTNQLADALRSNEKMRGFLSVPVSAAPVDLSNVPHREFKKVYNISEADMCRMEKDGWEVKHMQFMENNDLNVVYFRIVTSAPVAPEPLRGAVQAIPGTHTVFNAEEYLGQMVSSAALEVEQAVNQRRDAHQQVFREVFNFHRNRSLVGGAP